MTERDVEALAEVIRRATEAEILAMDAWTPDHTARAVLASGWHAERIAEARQAGAAEVIERVEAEIAARDFPEAAAGRVRYALRGDTP